MPNDSRDVAAGSPTPESFTDNQDGSVTDNVTGLMRQMTPATNASGDGGNIDMFSWSEALAYCPLLKVGGHGDWRLPSVIELVSIVDYSVAAPAATINGVFSPSTPAAAFFSSTPGGISTSGWYVNFASGVTSADGAVSAARIRCVR